MCPTHQRFQKMFLRGEPHQKKNFRPWQRTPPCSLKKSLLPSAFRFSTILTLSQIKGGGEHYLQTYRLEKLTLKLSPHQMTSELYKLCIKLFDFLHNFCFLNSIRKFICSSQKVLKIGKSTTKMYPIANTTATNYTPSSTQCSFSTKTPWVQAPLTGGKLLKHSDFWGHWVKSVTTLTF